MRNFLSSIKYMHVLYKPFVKGATPLLLVNYTGIVKSVPTFL